MSYFSFCLVISSNNVKHLAEYRELLPSVDQTAPSVDVHYVGDYVDDSLTKVVLRTERVAKAYNAKERAKPVQSIFDFGGGK